MADLVIPDISEFQGTPNLAGLQAVIVRAHNGYRPDKTFAANREAAHRAGCQVVGLYQYVQSATDPAAQARLLLDTVGPAQPGEFLICDLEESASAYQDENPRWQAWAAACRHAGWTVWLYTGESFARQHNLTPDWVAAYQSTEPSGTHKLWQYTDARQWPWGRSDASVYHGTVADLAATIHTPAPPSAGPARPPIQLGDHMQKIDIPGGVTLDPAGWTATDVPLPAGMTHNNYVCTQMDVASVYDPQSWKWCEGHADYNQPTAGHVRIVFKGDPGGFFTGRVVVA